MSTRDWNSVAEEQINLLDQMIEENVERYPHTHDRLNKMYLQMKKRFEDQIYNQRVDDLDKPVVETEDIEAEPARDELNTEDHRREEDRYLDQININDELLGRIRNIEEKLENLNSSQNNKNKNKNKNQKNKKQNKKDNMSIDKSSDEDSLETDEETEDSDNIYSSRSELVKMGLKFQERSTQRPTLTSIMPDDVSEFMKSFRSWEAKLRNTYGLPKADILQCIHHKVTAQLKRLGTDVSRPRRILRKLIEIEGEFEDVRKDNIIERVKEVKWDWGSLSPSAAMQQYLLHIDEELGETALLKGKEKRICYHILKKLPTYFIRGDITDLQEAQGLKKWRKLKKYLLQRSREMDQLNWRSFVKAPTKKKSSSNNPTTSNSANETQKEKNKTDLNNNNFKKNSEGQTIKLYSRPEAENEVNNMTGSKTFSENLKREYIFCLMKGICTRCRRDHHSQSCKLSASEAKASRDEYYDKRKRNWNVNNSNAINNNNIEKPKENDGNTKSFTNPMKNNTNNVMAVEKSMPDVNGEYLHNSKNILDVMKSNVPDGGQSTNVVTLPFDDVKHAGVSHRINKLGIGNIFTSAEKEDDEYWSEVKDEDVSYLPLNDNTLLEFEYTETSGNTWRNKKTDFRNTTLMSII
eukprot:snap_masked-scaffold_39-processed-gene-1.23-mRNA-1 protein AED:1.00 eAED:1.00 QI:0/-1/0/0/-1/1/1/0/635